MELTFLSKRKKLIGGIAISVLLVLNFVFNLFSFLEYKLQDRLYQKPSFVSPDIVVMGIDEAALSEFGRFQQWDRQIMADAINILNSSEDSKPAVIAVDVLFVNEGSRNSDESLAKAAQDGGNVVTVSQVTFGEDMFSNNVVKGYEIPYKELSEHASFGFANGTTDSDGIIRSATLKIPYDSETLHSFPYQIYKKYTERTGNDFRDTDNEVYTTYYGEPGEYTQGMSFADIFKEDFDPEYFADCIVLIGPYAPGFMDAYYTPLSQDVQMYGVEIHANVVQMLMEGNFKKYAPFAVNFLIVMLIILLGLCLGRVQDIRILLAVIAAVCIGYIFLAVQSFDRGYILTLIYPVFSLVILYIYYLIYGYVLETLEKQKVKSAFKKYVDPKLVDRLMETGEANSNEVGMKKNIAVLFVDVRGFTPMTEALKDQPELIVKILNEYLELTSSAVFNNGGSVDKFIGDATMALFNGFVPLGDFEFKAVKAAWDIVQGAAEVNASLKEKYNVDVGFGVGVNCGEAIVGNLGPSFRKDYTAIGDTVNTAARLESNAKRSEILISRNLYDIVKDRVEAVSVGEIPLKGKSIKLEIFSVKNIID